MKTWMRKLLMDWSPSITVGLLVISAIGFYLGSSVQLKLSLTDLLPQDHPAVVKFEKLTEVVGGVGYLAVVLHAEDKQSHLEIAPKLVEELEKSPEVRSAFYRRERKFFTDRMLYYLSLEKLQELRRNIKLEIRHVRTSVIDLGLWDEPAQKKEEKAFDDDLKKLAKEAEKISPYLTSEDKKTLLLMVKPTFDSTDLKRTKELIAFTKDVLDRTLPATVTYRFSERYYNKVVETDMVQRDIFVLGIAAIVGILLMLLVYLRDFRALVVIFGPIAMSLGITMGLTSLIIGHINIITGFLMGILSGLGVDYGIHLYLRLPLERVEPSSDHPDPVWRALESSGHSVFIGAMAAAFAFYLLCFSDFRAFSEFGFVCGTGIVTVFICLLGTYSTFTKLFKLDVRELPQMKKSGRLQFPVLPRKIGLISAGLFTVALVGLAMFVRFEYDFDKMLRQSDEIAGTQKLVDTVYGRSVTPSALSAPDKETAIAAEKMLRDKYMPSMVQDVISGATIVPDNQAEKHKILEAISKELKPFKDKRIEQALGVSAKAVRTWLTAKPFELKDIPVHLQDALRGKSQSGFLLYLYPAEQQNTAHQVRRYAAMIRDVESHYPSLLVGSDAVIFSDILDLIRRDGRMVLIVILISVGGFIWINMRRLDDSLYSFLPLLIAFPVGMGMMVLIGIKFNIFNIAIIPAFVAIGIDIPLHIVHRAREVKSGYKAARDLAAPSNLALLTTGVGFGVLIFAQAGILRSFGWVALLGTLAIWWVGLFLLPAYLEGKLNPKAT